MRRRLLAAVLTLLAVGSMGLAMSASAAPAKHHHHHGSSGSATPRVPTATVGVLGEHFVKFCVKGYAPNSTVKVVNTLTGAAVTIHTNGNGAGCAEVPIKRACHEVTQRIVATGQDASGKTVKTSAVVRAPATKSLCSSTAAGGGQSNSGGTLPFTGANIAVLVIAGLLLIGVGTAITVTVRRRQHAV